MKIAFRVDASAQIGTGHVMRCLTLAEVPRANVAKILFLCREHPGHLCDLVIAKGFEVIRLESVLDSASRQSVAPSLAHADWFGGSQSEDAAQSTAALQDNAPWDWLIVDHYALDARWETAMRPHCRKREQFNLLRVKDNERYPAWFELQGQRYVVKIGKQ